MELTLADGSTAVFDRFKMIGDRIEYIALIKWDREIRVSYIPNVTASSSV